ncbi:MAG: ankyrin repeat domain-containing protein [Proteobacteria bacterium]|nr:ankyrin repeat domain-containing protein [Pseudomonadota bacterium]
MNNRIAVITGLIASLALSACNKAETPAPDTTQTPSAQTENNHSNEAKPENQAPAEQQAKDSEQAQPDAQAPAAAGNDRLFQAESAEQFKALIAEGVDVNTRDNNGRTVLFDVDLDFAKGGDYSKAIEIAKILIDAGIDVNAKDKDGKSVLFEITYVKEIEPYLKLLLDHGADAKVKAKDGSTVLFVATNKEDYGDKCVPQLVKMLIDAGADVDAKNNKGQTFLEAADENCKNLIVSTLKLPAKISLSESEIKSILSIMGVKAQNVNKQDEDGCTPLFFVNNAREASALIASGADVNHVADDGETALFWAVRDNKDPMIAKVLVDAGANVNHHSKDGYTALFYAESEDFVKMLVSCGANIF